MGSGASWQERPVLAVGARVAAGAVVALALAGVAVGVVAAAADTSLGVRLAWAPVAALLALPVALVTERVAVFLWTLGDVLERRLDFSDRAPSRVRVAWLAATPRGAEMLAARAVDPEPPAAESVVALVVGALRHHPIVRERSPLAHRYLAQIGEEAGLSPAEGQRARWALDLRLAADAVPGASMDRWLANAVQVVPGGPPASARRALTLAGLTMIALDLSEDPEPTPTRRDRSMTAARVVMRARSWTQPWRLAPALVGGFAALGLLATAAALTGQIGAGSGNEERPRVAGVTVDNAAPVPVEDAATVTVGIPADVDVLGNDRDPDGDALTILRFDQGAFGSVERFGPGLRYVAGTSGIDRFSYVVSDSHGGESSALVTVTVLAALPSE
ncbi:MAG TPA: Ig-like domain-containing protein [Acidimicrobiia bacterium]|nr:Ig-like domain-containing protein [Acidimicrobiia bacterium]